MAGPRLPGEGPEVGDDPGPQGIQVTVADELPQVGLRLHHDRLVPALKKVPML